MENMQPDTVHAGVQTARDTVDARPAGIIMTFPAAKR